MVWSGLKVLEDGCFFPNFRREIDGESYAKGSIVGMEVCAAELRTESERLVWVAAIPIKVVVEK